MSADPPAIAFAEELVDVYPEAKVVLVERDIDSWYSSFNAAVINTMEPASKFSGRFRSLDPWGSPGLSFSMGQRMVEG